MVDYWGYIIQGLFTGIGTSIGVYIVTKVLFKNLERVVERTPIKNNRRIYVTPNIVRGSESKIRERDDEPVFDKVWNPDKIWKGRTKTFGKN